jgi:NAD-dependent DNA ligase
LQADYFLVRASGLTEGDRRSIRKQGMKGLKVVSDAFVHSCDATGTLPSDTEFAIVLSPDDSSPVKESKAAAGKGSAKSKSRKPKQPKPTSSDDRQSASAMGSVFAGAPFVLGSSLDPSSAAALTKSIASAGGRIHPKLSSKTAYFVVSKDGSIDKHDRKSVAKATKLGVSVVTDDFVAHSLESGFQQVCVRVRGHGRLFFLWLCLA